VEDFFENIYERLVKSFLTVSGARICQNAEEVMQMWESIYFGVVKQKGQVKCEHPSLLEGPEKVEAVFASIG
jgi:hypothetical protein